MMDTDANGKYLMMFPVRGDDKAYLTEGQRGSRTCSYACWRATCR